MVDQTDLLNLVLNKSRTISAGKDVMIYEGGGSLREGYVVGLPTTKMSKELDSQVLAIVRYKDKSHLIDDVLAAKSQNLLYHLLPKVIVETTILPPGFNTLLNSLVKLLYAKV